MVACRIWHGWPYEPWLENENEQFPTISGVYAALCHCTALTILIAIVLKAESSSLAKGFGSCLSFSTLRISRSATVAEATQSFTGPNPGISRAFPGLSLDVKPSIRWPSPVEVATGCHWFTEAALFAEAVTHDCSLRSGMKPWWEPL